MTNRTIYDIINYITNSKLLSSAEGRNGVMGRASTKTNKNQFQLAREALGLTREKASSLLEVITPDRLVKIEGDKTNPYPEEILAMSKVYQMPDLCNYYCSNICPIGQV